MAGQICTSYGTQPYFGDFRKMSGKLKYIIFETDMGWVGILASARGLLATTLPQPTAPEARQLLERINEANKSPDAFHDLVERLKEYYRGRKVAFPDKLDLTGATSFQRAVWTAAQRIPYGETRSYRWVAERIGKPQAARAVGQALGRNPLAIIVPCHRVVASDGGLGGFGGGLEMKRRLLQREASAATR
jgi:methylated-DNA-[protein]-cysteine S-methyltransferase